MTRLFTGLLPIVIIAVLACATGALADGVDSRSLAGDMVNEMLRHKLQSWEDSALHGYFPRSSIVGGAGEKVANKLIEENGDTLGFMLTESGLPSSVNDNPYVELTKNLSGKKSKELALAEMIMASPGDLMPDQVLGMALEVCHGDYWLATLTAHNMLKEVTYAERKGQQPILGWDGSNPGNADKWKMIKTKDVTDKLRNLRASSDQHFDDKMGPWYHMYGLFFVGGMTSGDEADFLAWMENVTRWLGLGSTSDPFKEDMNTWAANLSHALNEMVVEGIYAPADLGMLSKDELQALFDKLRAKHKALQPELEEMAALVNSRNMGDYAVWRMDVIRDMQKSYYNEALRVREEMNSRP